MSIQISRIHKALVIDSNETTTNDIIGLLGVIHVECDIVNNAEQIIEKIKAKESLSGYDVIIIDSNIDRGHELIRLIRKEYPLSVILIFTTQEKTRGYALGANIVITQPFKHAEFQYVIKNLLSVVEAAERLSDANKVIDVLSQALEARDSYTIGHAKRVCSLSLRLFDAMGLSDPEQKKNLHIGATLHDIGKIGVPDNILKSDQPLTPEERVLVQNHVKIGVDICKNVMLRDEVVDIVHYHHERYDGSGYPDGLDNGYVPILAQIVGICDIWDAMTSARTYRKPLTVPAAVADLRKMSNDKKLEKRLVEVFIDDVIRADK